MDLSAYAALGGIERVAVIVGALIIGYWGFRLYGRDKTPGLVFMGIACAVLVLALATGGAYLRSVGTSYQLASADPERSTGAADASARSEASASGGSDRPAASAPSIAAGSQETAANDGDAASAGGETRTGGKATPGAESQAAAAATGQAAAGDVPSSNTVEAEAPMRTAAEEQIVVRQSNSDAPSTGDIDLANSQELGGRIVSVKSDKVTLEWSRE